MAPVETTDQVDALCRAWSAILGHRRALREALARTNDLRALGEKLAGPTARPPVSDGPTGVDAFRRLRASGAIVAVGTCPDFGVITAIPQPLRTVARTRGLRLARAQAAAVRTSGGIPVPLADLLTPDFRQAPELFFSDDMFHPSGAGYALAAKQLLPALCNALGDMTATAEPESPLQTRTADVNTLLSRLGGVSRLWRRSTGVPAPIVVPAS